MKSKRLLTLIGSLCLTLALVAIPLVACTPEEPTPTEAVWPEDVAVCCPSAGGSFHACLVGMGTPVVNHTAIEHWIVQPLGGPLVWAPLMKKGEMDFAGHNAADVLQNSFLGQGPFEDMGPMPVRTVTLGHSYGFMWHTTPSTGVKSIADLKGKRVYTGLKGNPMFPMMAEAQLNSVGLTTADLGSADCMPSIKQATDDLIEGRIDAFLYPIVPSAVMQINEAKGECVFLSLTKEQADFVAEKMPGYYVSVIEAGNPSFANKSEIKYAICYRGGLHVRADMDPEVVYGVVKALLEHHDEWRDCHPQAEFWGPEYKPADTCTEPYHEGAIKYFKEKGYWSDELQAHQDKYLKLQQERMGK